MKQKTLTILFAVWVALWAFLIGRELLFKKNVLEYKALSGMSLDEKHSYVTGDRLYGFIGFCKSRLPGTATYALEGVEEGSIERRRAVYYLYPLTESENADYVLVYGDANSDKPGYLKFAVADGTGCILVRERPAR